MAPPALASSSRGRYLAATASGTPAPRSTSVTCTAASPEPSSSATQPGQRPPRSRRTAWWSAPGPRPSTVTPGSRGWARTARRRRIAFSPAGASRAATAGPREAAASTAAAGQGPQPGQGGVVGAGGRRPADMADAGRLQPLGQGPAGPGVGGLEVDAHAVHEGAGGRGQLLAARGLT